MPRRELLTPTERVQLFAFPEDESELILLSIGIVRGSRRKVRVAMRRSRSSCR